jgi:hypothetical protein
MEESGSFIMHKYSSPSYNKTYYMSTYFKATWMDAYQFCKSSGMQLMTFDSENEYKEVFGVLTKNYALYAGKMAINLIYFGASNTVLGTKNGWVWYDSGKPITFALDWGAGQPNNAGGNQLCGSFINGGAYGKLKL